MNTLQDLNVMESISQEEIDYLVNKEEERYLVENTSLIEELKSYLDNHHLVMYNIRATLMKQMLEYQGVSAQLMKSNE